MENQKVICGRNPVFEYLKGIKSGDQATLLIAENAHGKIIQSITDLANHKKIVVKKCEKEKLNNLSGEARNQGVVLLAKNLNVLEKTNITEDSVLEDLIATQGTAVLLDQLTDPHNVGSIIRTAEALGVNSIILAKNNAVDLTPTVIKCAAGATAYIQIAKTTNIANFIDKAKKQNIWVVGTSDHGSSDLSKLKELHPLIIVIGAEGDGMRRLTEEKCDMVVKIPLKGETNSLNASVAAAIAIYEATKD